MYRSSKMTKKLAIVAQGVSIADYLFYCMRHGGREYAVDEVWAINATGGVIHHDLLFHMDDCKVQEARGEAGNITIKNMMEVIKKHPNFFTSKVYPDYPGAKRYPLEEVCNNLRTTYLNGTCAYALAYAIYRGVYEEVLLFGMDFYADGPNDSTAALESGRACVEFLIGIANERGIKVLIAPRSRLLDVHVPEDQKPYGYDAYNVIVSMDDSGKYNFKFEDKLLPSAEEMEERYSHLVKKGI